MRRILDLRITRWPIKLAYIVVLWVAGSLLHALLSALSVTQIAANIIDSIVLLAGILLAARIFRGEGEPTAPARPWWQMTAWPTLSLVLGIFISIGNLISVVGIGLTVADTGWEEGPYRISAGDNIANLVSTVIVAALYLNSSIRQRRAGVVRPATDAAPPFRPTNTLD